jgi:pimeloyl-ACP methyl ester carboxylesterase
MEQLSRRRVLSGAAAAGAAVATVAATGRSPAAAGGRGRRRRRPVTTFVIVAGANGSGGGEAELTLRGHRTVGVGVPVTGQFRRSYQCPQDLAALASEPSPMAGITLDDYTERGVEVVRRAAEHGPVVLWGGSMGGATLNRVANEVPHLIDRLVYSSAFCCVDLRSVGDYLTTPEGAGTAILDLTPAALADPAVIGGTRTNWRTADPAVLDLLHGALQAGSPDDEFLAMLNTMQPDESAQVPLDDARGHADTWGRVPRTYIRHTEDRVIPPALQDRMIAEADRLTPGNRFDVRSVATTHAPDAAGFAETIEILDGLAPT